MCGYGAGLGSDQPPCVGLGGGVWFLTNHQVWVWGECGV